MFPAKRKMSDCVWSIVVCDFCEISFSCLVFFFFFLQVVRLWIKHRWGVRMRSRLRLKRRKVTKWVCVWWWWCSGGVVFHWTQRRHSTVLSDSPSDSALMPVDSSSATEFLKGEMWVKSKIPSSSTSMMGMSKLQRESGGEESEIKTLLI